MAALVIPDEIKASGTLGRGNATVKEAAAFLRLSLATVYELMDKRQLPYCRFGRARRVPWNALLKFSEAALVGAVDSDGD